MLLTATIHRRTLVVLPLHFRWMGVADWRLR